MAGNGSGSGFNKFMIGVLVAVVGGLMVNWIWARVGGDSGQVPDERTSGRPNATDSINPNPSPNNKSVAVTPAKPSTLSELAPFYATGSYSDETYRLNSKPYDWNQNVMKIAGTSYSTGVQLAMDEHRPGTLRWNFDGQYSRLTATVGLDDLVKGSGGIVVRFFGDGQELKTLEFARGSLPQEIDLNITGVRLFEMVATNTIPNLAFGGNAWVDLVSTKLQ